MKRRRRRGQHGSAGIYLRPPCGGSERVIELPLRAEEQAGLRAPADVLRRTLLSLRAQSTRAA